MSSAFQQFLSGDVSVDRKQGVLSSSLASVSTEPQSAAQSRDRASQDALPPTKERKSAVESRHSKPQARLSPPQGNRISCTAVRCNPTGSASSRSGCCARGPPLATSAKTSPFPRSNLRAAAQTFTILVHPHAPRLPEARIRLNRINPPVHRTLHAIQEILHVAQDTLPAAQMTPPTTKC